MGLTDHYRQKGIGLIEAMVAALIFALGALALVKMHEVIFRQATVAQARFAAMTLAEQKLEDLRGFQTYEDADADIFDFTSIANNSGGQCDDTDNSTCTLDLPATSGNKSITIGNTAYSRDWTVTNYYYTSAGALTTTPPSGAVIAHKAIVITITWTDIDGSNQSIILNGVINHNTGESGGLLVSNTGGSGEKPVVPYTPSNDPRVTPIEVGTVSKRETLVPGSETVDGYTFTEFTAYTYGPDENGDNVLIRQEDFKNVACECAFDGVTSDSNPAYGASYPAWDSDSGTYVDVTGDVFNSTNSKVKGCVDTNGNGACDSNPDAYCEICCRDHHDSATATRKYDPYRSTDDYVSGNHKHYRGTTPVTTGTYIESCRLKRIDGYWRVYQDWHQVGYKVVALSDLTNSTTKIAYADYVNDLIDQHLDESKVAGETLTSSPTFPSTLDHTVSGNYIPMNVGDTSQLSARGIYLDYMDSTHLAQVQTKKSASQDYLLHVPYYEVDVTLVSHWTSAVPASVKPGPYTGPGTDLIAGQLEALATNASAVPVTGAMKKSASGLTDLAVAIDYDAITNADDEENSHAVNVCVGCSGGASCNTPWGSTVANGSPVTAYLAASVIDPATCSSQTRTCNNGTLSGTYQYPSCSVIPPSQDCISPWGATVINGSAVLAYLGPTPPTTCISEWRACTNGTLSGTYQYQACTVTPPTCVTTVTGSANNKNDTIVVNDGSANRTCNVAANKAYTCPPVTTVTSAIITVTSSGTVNSTTTLVTNCGQQTVNF